MKGEINISRDISFTYDFQENVGFTLSDRRGSDSVRYRILPIDHFRKKEKMGHIFYYYNSNIFYQIANILLPRIKNIAL